MKKNILLIGIGGTGSNAVETFHKKFVEFGNQTDNKVTALVFDTDAGDLKKITSARTVVMADTASVGTIVDRIGRQYLEKWFPCDAKDVRAQEMVRGASQWRKKSYLAFLNLMNKPAARQTFISALEEMVQDPGASCEVYVIASVAGGTGSGSFIPIALYAKRYLRKNLGKDPIVNAMIALPDIYAESQTPENKVKVYSNAYAILRELNAINLVSRNYNAGLTAKKKAPVKFRIGHPDEPNVGVLFDASDKRFWTPEAAPFSQVFLLDRIPGLNSVSAHDMVLANSLYTILCTEIGAAFDSEFSNHELVRSQNNGSNAIYAGISTSQVRFPKETVLDYLALKKTLESCNGEWLTLHKAVENEIRDKTNEAKAAKQQFTMENDAYARIVLDKIKQAFDNNTDSITSIVERCVDVYEKGKRSNKTASQKFLDVINNAVTKRVPSVKTVTEEVLAVIPEAKATPKPDKETFAGLFEDEVYTLIFDFYKDCFNAIKCVPVSTADSVITFDKRKMTSEETVLSMAPNLLISPKDKKKYIHPVGALIRLCQFRVDLETKIKENKIDDWAELKNRNVTELPGYLTNIQDTPIAGKSAYAKLGEDRFSKMVAGSEEYENNKTNVASDISVLGSDVVAILNKISGETVAQINRKIYSAIAADVDLLISKYRAFFNRFEKEKENLKELMRDALRKDSGAIDSVVNVYSSEKNKEQIALDLEEGNGPVTEADILNTDDIVGRGVYSSVTASAVAERSNDEDFNENDAGAYNSLFNDMVKSYRESIEKSEVYKEIASYNAVEAIVASCGDNATNKDVDDAMREAFSIAQEKAVPSLRIEKCNSLDLVNPSSIMVFMVSLNTAKYIKKNADRFGLRLPADQNSESAVLRSCTEQFVRDYSGNTSARVAIVNSIPDQILYCTGEVMDITPLCIAKFNELGDDTYFKNYTDALRRFKKYETDMWNPHLGNDLHKRGSLPYMNPEMENACDEKMVKALLFALKSERIRYDDGAGASAYGHYYFICDGQKIKVGNTPVSNQNVHDLLNWMRDQEQKIDLWSAQFDSWIEKQKASIPNIISDNEVAPLEAALTGSEFSKLLCDFLYKNPEGKYKMLRSNEWKSKDGPSAIEFAYAIKTREEGARDNDDADRIIKVLYKVFCDIIESKVSPETYPDRFIRIYKQQIQKFYEAIASIDLVVKAGKDARIYFKQVIDWINGAGLFLDINGTLPFDEEGKILINEPFTLDKSDANTVIRRIEKAKADSDEE